MRRKFAGDTLFNNRVHFKTKHAQTNTKYGEIISGEPMSLQEIQVIASNDEAMSAPEPGLRRQVMSYSPSMMLIRHTMKKGWIGVKHSHPHEQMVYIVSGRILFEYPGQIIEAIAGMSFLVPGDVEHQARALEDCEVLDIFTPMREDYA